MKRIPLTGKYGKGKYALVSDGDFERVNKRKWHLSKCNGETYYPRTSYWEDGKIVNKKLHQFLMGKKDGLVLDHINRNTLDNRRSNLRFVTQQENAQNVSLSKKNKSGVRGVYQDLNMRGSKNWCATLRKNGKNTLIGKFYTLKDASMARLEAEKIHYV